MSILNPCDKFRIEYTELLEREAKADKYFEECKSKLSNPMIPDKEKEEVLLMIEKWTPNYNEIQKRLSDLLTEIKFYTPDNIRFGWPEILNPELKTITEEDIKHTEMIKSIFCAEPVKEVIKPVECVSQNMFEN